MKNSFARSCALLLLHLYPRAWHERYADEVMALLEECPPSLRTVCDLLLGMVDAHLHADLFTARTVLLRLRLRSSYFMIYLCAIFFFSFCDRSMIYSCSNFLYYLVLFCRSHGGQFTDDAFLYECIMWILNAPAALLQLFTLFGSLVFIARFLKQVLTNRYRAIFLIWGFVSVVSIVAFSYGVPYGVSLIVSNVVLPYQLVFLLMGFINISSFLALFSNQLCIALVFASLYQMFKKWQEKQSLSAMLWMASVVIPLILIVCNTIFQENFYNTIAQESTINIQRVNILLGLLVFGGCFVSVLRGVRYNEGARHPVRASYLSLLPYAIITLCINVIAISTLMLTFRVFPNFPLPFNQYALPLFKSIALFLIVLAIYASISLWRSFLAQRELTSLYVNAHENESTWYEEQSVGGQMMMYGDSSHRNPDNY